MPVAGNLDAHVIKEAALRHARLSQRVHRIHGNVLSYASVVHGDDDGTGALVPVIVPTGWGRSYEILGGGGECGA